jgi:hypothetical protein
MFEQFQPNRHFRRRCAPADVFGQNLHQFSLFQFVAHTSHIGPIAKC